MKQDPLQRYNSYRGLRLAHCGFQPHVGTVQVDDFSTSDESVHHRFSDHFIWHGYIPFLRCELGCDHGGSQSFSSGEDIEQVVRCLRFDRSSQEII